MRLNRICGADKAPNIFENKLFVLFCSVIWLNRNSIECHIWWSPNTIFELALFRAQHKFSSPHPEAKVRCERHREWEEWRGPELNHFGHLDSSLRNWVYGHVCACVMFCVSASHLLIFMFVKFMVEMWNATHFSHVWTVILALLLALLLQRTYHLIHKWCSCRSLLSMQIIKLHVAMRIYFRQRQQR